MQDNVMTAEEMRWFALGVAGVVITIAVLWQFAVERWRLLAVGAALLSAVAAALFAIHGPDAKLMQRFPEFGAEIWLAIRAASAASAAWAAYIAIYLLRTWWRIGDKPDDG